MPPASRATPTALLPTMLLPARLLDALFAVSLVGVLLTAVSLPLYDAPAAGPRAMLCVAGTIVLGGLWWWRRRVTGQARVATTIAFTLAAVGVSYAGDVILAMLPVFCALLVLALDIAPLAATVLVVVLVALQGTRMVLAGRGVEAFDQSVGTGAVLAFILAFALLLRRTAGDAAERLALLTERDEANARLTEANARLQGSIETEKELVLARERSRAARDLHDGLGHRLTLVTMSLDFALRARDRTPDRAWEEVATARATTGEAIDEMRLWVRALSPVAVEGLQGAAALDAVAEAFRGTGVDVTVSTLGEERPLPDDVVLFLHRFVQEGLTNALRHARARRVTIDLAYGTDDVTITSTDDGRTHDDGRDAGGDTGSASAAGADGVAATTDATDIEDADVVPGFGLRSLSERASALGGEVATHRGEDGLVLTARIPAPRAADTPAVPSASAVAALVSEVAP
ncbi:sensor histidine kinase [Mobilicoccus pelagius]|nr:sensor histidine kinase [Mobilicoccus pelagius]